MPHTLIELKQAQHHTRKLLGELRQRDTTNTNDAAIALDMAIEHVEAALNTLRVAVKRENNRLVDMANERGM
jgi:hypothetical protein